MVIPMICGICGKRYRRKITRRGTAYAAPVWICSTYNYRGKVYCASKQIPEPILQELMEVCEAFEPYTFATMVEKVVVGRDGRLEFFFRNGMRYEHQLNKGSG